LNRGTNAQKAIGNLTKVFHRRAEQRDLTKRRRLERIVPPRRLERSADENQVGNPVDPCELSNRIKQEHGARRSRYSIQYSYRSSGGAVQRQ